MSNNISKLSNNRKVEHIKKMLSGEQKLLAAASHWFITKKTKNLTCQVQASRSWPDLLPPQLKRNLSNLKQDKPTIYELSCQVYDQICPNIIKQITALTAIRIS